MRLPLLTLLISTATSLAAQTHDFFPPNFTTSPCAPANSCQTFADSEITSAAFRFYGLQLDMNWVTAHRDTMLKQLETACRRHATCLATPGNTFWFCDDVLAAEARPLCDKLFPGDEQCKTFRETHLLGIDLHAKPLWDQAQACASKLPPVTHTKPLEVWMTPSLLPPGFRGKLTFYTLDPDTHVPVLATVSFENQIIYAKANPAGLPATIYPFDYTVKFKRVPNADGHNDVVPPMVTVSAASYPASTFRLPAEVPKMMVEMKPSPDRLRRGKNVVTVQARDATTGKPVEARVMFGDDVAGDTNKPIILEVKRGPRPEIWLTSLFDQYSDVVVAKAAAGPAAVRPAGGRRY